MNIEKFRRIIGNGKLLQAGEHFPLLDMSAWLDFHTENSAGFSIGEVKGNVYTTQGHFDIHHTCFRHIKVQLRGSLPEKYLTYEQLKEAVDQIFVALAIPADETYEAIFIPAMGGIILNQYVDRDGMSDRLVTRK